MVTAAVLLVAPFCRAAQNIASTVQQADMAVAQRKFNRARSLYERALTEGASFQNDPPHARNVAAAFFSSSPPDLVNGIKWLRQAVALEPRADGLRAQLAGFLLLSGDAEGAIAHYRVLVDAHPQSSEYVLGLARALRAAGRSDAALELLHRTVTAYPNLVPVRVEYARRLNFEKQFAEARRQFAAVLAIDPGNVIAQVGSAKAISFAGDQETALALYDRILRRHPGLYDAIVGKAFSLLWSGRTAEARPLLEQAVRRHPEDNEVRDALNALPGASPQKALKESSSGRHRIAAERQTTADRPNVVEAPSQREVAAPNPPVLVPKPPAPAPHEHGMQNPWWRVVAHDHSAEYALALSLLIAIFLLPHVFRRRPKYKANADAPSQSLTKSTLFNPQTVGGGDEAPGDSAGMAATRDADEGIPSTRISPICAMPAGETCASQVLLVGGSDPLVELERGWLANQAIAAVSEREWIPAIVRLLNVPFDLIVFNPATDDGWTSLRMFNWTVANLPQLRHRTLLIKTAGIGAEQASGAGAPCVSEPFGEQEWREAINRTLQIRATEVDGAAHADAC